MTDSFLNAPPKCSNQIEIKSAVILSRLFLILAGLTFFLMILGSTTRVMNAGLACPDWPLCYGELIPAQQMTLQVFLEWFHRLIATTVGVAMIIITVLSWRWHKQLPRWIPQAATGCLGLVIVQGGLGGLTVTQFLRFDIVTAHLGTGLLFFSALLALGSALLPYPGTGVVGPLPGLSILAWGCVYGQSILGGLVASRWAAHQCLGASRLCSVMYSHFTGVVPATLSVLLLVIWAGHIPALHPRLRLLTQGAAVLLGLQICVGGATLWLHLQVVGLTIAHQAIGALLLGTLVMLGGVALRDRHPPPAMAQVHGLVDGSYDQCPGSEHLHPQPRDSISGFESSVTLEQATKG